LAALFTAVGIFPRLQAQDVTVGDAVWAAPEPAPDVMPAPRSRLRPDYPDEMRKTDEIGYAIIFRYVDATGKGLSMSANGTHVPFQRSVEEAMQDWEMRPATRGGQKVNAEVWIPVIFNPRSATTKGADATPRLLAVTPVITPSRPMRGSNSAVVRMRLSLDAAGAITQAVPENEVNARPLAAIQDALKNWRFAPARRNGQPVAADTLVSVLCQSAPRPAQAKIVPANPIRQQKPVYPFAMRRFGITGQVMIDFTVDKTGKVQNPVIFQSDNPAFEEPALKALREWKFEPATQEGKPVEVKQRVPIVFQLDGFSGQSAFAIESHGDQSKLPPELQYDTPPKIRGVLVPVYPYAQRHDGVRGTVKATMLINQQGRVSAVKVQAADQPEFGLAFTAALEGFTFDPALKDGRPVPHLLKFEQTFSSFELPDDEADRVIALEKKHPEKIIAGAGTLDAPLKPVSRRAPRFPTGLAENVTSGQALVHPERCPPRRNQNQRNDRPRRVRPGAAGGIGGCPCGRELICDRAVAAEGRSFKRRQFS
jgi:TonB family protein